jgi:hypothetical protein
MLVHLMALVRSLERRADEHGALDRWREGDQIA